MLRINARYGRYVTVLLVLALSALTVRAAAPNPPSNVCINGICTAATVPATTTTSNKAVKWHPGTYVWFAPAFANDIPGHRLDLTPQRDELLAFIDSICREASIKGIQAVAVMRALEGDTPGDYKAGFATVDAILARLAPCNKRLMLSVQTVWFSYVHSPYDVYPAYIINTPSLGYSRGDPADIIAMRTWQQASMDRVIALVQAYGARYNGNPNVEMITFDETSRQIKTDGFSPENLLAQYKRLVTATRAAWPNTAIRVSANDMGALSNLADLMQHCKTYYCSVGGPDIWPGDITDANAVFVGKNKMGYPGIGIPGNGADIYEDLRDKLPWTAEAQWQSYNGRWSMQQLWNTPNIGYDPEDGDFHMPSMKTRYMVWYANFVNGNAGTQWSTGILPFIRSTNGAVASTTCPSLYPACNTN